MRLLGLSAPHKGRELVLRRNSPALKVPLPGSRGFFLRECWSCLGCIGESHKRQARSFAPQKDGARSLTVQVGCEGISSPSHDMIYSVPPVGGNLMYLVPPVGGNLKIVKDPRKGILFNGLTDWLSVESQSLVLSEIQAPTTKQEKQAQNNLNHHNIQ